MVRRLVLILPLLLAAPHQTVFGRVVVVPNDGPQAVGVTCTTTSGSAQVTGCNSTEGLFEGAVVAGPGIPSGATVSRGIKADSFILSVPAGVGASTGLVTFRPSPFWSDVDGGSPAITRHKGRLMVGGAVGNIAARSGTNLTICPADATCGKYLVGRDSQFSVISTRGGPAISGTTRSGDGDDVSNPPAPIGVSAYALQSSTSTRPVWGMYSEAVRTTTQNAYGIEIDAKNMGTNTSPRPYDVATLSGAYGIWLAAGGDNTYGGVVANPSAAGLVIKKNASTWNTGILFEKDALTGADGLTGLGQAIKMARNHVISWDADNGGPGATAFRLYSDVVDATKNVRIIATDDVVGMYNSAGTVSIKLAHVAGTTKANALALYDAPTTTAPQVAAEGTDTNVNLRLTPKGTGVIEIPTGGLKLPVYPVADLPTCNAANAYTMAAVSDATAPTYNSALAGNGTVKIPVFCNGSAWTAH